MCHWKSSEMETAELSDKNLASREFPSGPGVSTFTAVAQVQSLAGELRSHKPHGVAIASRESSLTE